MKSRGLSDEDIQKLKRLYWERRDQSNFNDPLGAEGENEFYCQECGSRITETSTWGEVGHYRNCPRRQERYRGRVGRRGVTPPNAKHDRELVTDGGER